MPGLDDQEPPPSPSPSPPPLLSPNGGAPDRLAAEEDGLADKDQLRFLSRSPHPYHHQSFELLHPSDTLVSRGPRRSAAPGSAAPASLDLGRPQPPSSSSPSTVPPSGGTASPPRHRESPRPVPSAVPSSSSISSGLLHPPFAVKADSSTPTSDSGTDADDEHYLKGLPAPKTRLHKGLRGRNEPLSGTSTPLLSPALLEEEGRRVPSASSLLHIGDGVSKALETSLRDRRAIAERTRRKKEIIRRGTEFLILFSLGAILYSNRDVKPFVHAWSKELGGQALLAVILVVLYPLRVVLWAYTQDDSQPSKKLPLSAPASFDPAPIFYPPTIPLYVALLLAPTNKLAILPNLVLSLASLPKQLIPLAPSGELCSPVHWLITTMPLIISGTKSPHWGQGRLEAVTIRETAVLLYPLHQNLCMVLHRLTTTSLLPAELQLLSIALINILLLSTSPQMVILKAILWGGGMGILVSCGQVIRWGISLARVPKWRFRRVLPSSKRSSIFRKIAHLLPLRRVRHDAFGGAGSVADDTDSGSLTDVSHYRSRHASSHRNGDLAGGRVSFDTALHQQPTLLGSRTFVDGEEIEPLYLSPQEDKNTNPPEIRFNVPSPTEPAAATHNPPPPTFFASATTRRHTLPILPSAASANASVSGGGRSKTHTPSGRRKRSASSSIRAFFSLTQAQATARKWLYAAWVYVCILTVAFGFLRAYVGRAALGGEEPVGWALGYMFGDVPSFRLWVVKSSLENWICLPRLRRHDYYFSEPSSSSSAATAAAAILGGLGLATTTDHAGQRPCVGYGGWVEHLRHASVGDANTRLVLSAYWLAIIVTGLAVVFKLTPIYEVDTRRKVFHFMMVGMLLPATFVDPTYVALALALVLAIFLLLDLIRASQLPPLSKPIASFLTPYVDGRDLRGPVVISHIFLLIGCSIPLWLSLAALGRTSSSPAAGGGSGGEGGGGGGRGLAGWEVPTRDTSMVSGVVCVGLGDAAASLIGRRWGHRKWVWGGGKSLEGSVAFAVAVFVGLVTAGFWLRVGGWAITSEGLREECCLNGGGGGGGSGAGLLQCAWSWTRDWASWARSVRGAAVCGSMASLTEAVLTGGNDNVVVPVVLWTCVKSLNV